MSEQQCTRVRQLCALRKDKRYRAGLIDGFRNAEVITQREWLTLRTRYTDFKKFAENDHYLKQRGE